MVDIKSNDYHDFVIKNGVLLAEFEQMYVKSKEMPWHQDKQGNWLDVRLTLDILEEHAFFDYICDFGCGLGYYLSILGARLGSKTCRLVGYDVSQTCCDKARTLFPKAEFICSDITKKCVIKNQRSLPQKKLFSIRGTLWYVFPEMNNVVNRIASQSATKDLLLISQNFPPLDSDFVGKNIISNPDSIIKWFDKYFIPVKTLFLEDHDSDGNDNWFIGIFKRR